MYSIRRSKKKACGEGTYEIIGRLSSSVGMSSIVSLGALAPPVFN